MLAVLLQSATGLISAFVPWYELFLFLKFVGAVATGGTMVVSFVLRKYTITDAVTLANQKMYKKDKNLIAIEYTRTTMDTWSEKNIIFVF